MQKTILIVDDEQDVVDLVRYNLQRAGFAVIPAMDGIAAVAEARDRRPDAIVLDLMLPHMDGLAVCRKLKGDPNTADIPIIMLTAKSLQDDKISGLETGADDYLTKPFSPKELILRLQSLLRRSIGTTGATTVTIGDFHLDKGAFEFTLAGDRIELTTTEFKLLVTLIERRGKVLSRETLLFDVWGYKASVDTRTVDTHMRRLRSKLETHSDKIETIRGEGYRFLGE